MHKELNMPGLNSFGNFAWRFTPHYAFWVAAIQSYFSYSIA